MTELKDILKNDEKNNLSKESVNKIRSNISEEIIFIGNKIYTRNPCGEVMLGQTSYIFPEKRLHEQIAYSFNGFPQYTKKHRIIQRKDDNGINLQRALLKMEQRSHKIDYFDAAHYETELLNLETHLRSIGAEHIYDKEKNAYDRHKHTIKMYEIIPKPPTTIERLANGGTLYRMTGFKKRDIVSIYHINTEVNIKQKYVMEQSKNIPTNEEIIAKYELLNQNNTENHTNATRILEALEDNAPFYSGRILKREEYERFLEERKAVLDQSITRNLTDIVKYSKQ